MSDDQEENLLSPPALVPHSGQVFYSNNEPQARERLSHPMRQYLQRKRRRLQQEELVVTRERSNFF